MEARPAEFFGAGDGFTHRYAGSMFTHQGPNIQGSQRIFTANFNYTTSQQQRDPTHRVDNIEQVARDFVNHYYTTFCNNPAGLANLYKDDSVLTFVGEIFRGPQNIIAKLTSLPHHQCQYRVSFDHQASTSGSILVFVRGELQVGGRPPTLHFTQVFHLMPSQGSFYIANDMFRFISA